jgi:hypothetical protein
MRDRLFGGGPAPADTTRAQQQVPDTAGTRTFSGRDTTKPADSSAVRPAGNNGTKPQATKPHRDSAAPPQPPRPIPGPAVVTLPDVEDIFDPGKRDAARQKAEAIYRRQDVSDSMRAIAANMAAAAYQEDKKYADALLWAQRSQGLRPTDQGQALVDRLNKLVSP